MQETALNAPERADLAVWLLGYQMSTRMHARGLGCGSRLLSPLFQTTVLILGYFPACFPIPLYGCVGGCLVCGSICRNRWLSEFKVNYGIYIPFEPYRLAALGVGARA